MNDKIVPILVMVKVAWSERVAKWRNGGCTGGGHAYDPLDALVAAMHAHDPLLVVVNIHAHV
jgi:hypothetical protein